MTDLSLLITSIALGIGLAMDAFSVSLANGLHEPFMSRKRLLGIALVYALFQFLMPVLGWTCVHTIETFFEAFRGVIPWIAFILLIYIGGKMIIEGVREKRAPGDDHTEKKLSAHELLLQGIATSIDALSVGFTISDYDLPAAGLSASIIGVETFVICVFGLVIGKRAGTKLSWKASVLGGVILCAIGIEILIKGLLKI